MNEDKFCHTELSNPKRLCLNEPTYKTKTKYRPYAFCEEHYKLLKVSEQEKFVRLESE